eukprot:Sspe_Gene.87087::Locus_57998_Transcript_1_1_Confidence_1.000_Length_606::g.87087::m.87087
MSKKRPRDDGAIPAYLCPMCAKGFASVKTVNRHLTTKCERNLALAPGHRLEDIRYWVVDRDLLVRLQGLALKTPGAHQLEMKLGRGLFAKSLGLGAGDPKLGEKAGEVFQKLVRELEEAEEARREATAEVSPREADSLSEEESSRRLPRCWRGWAGGSPSTATPISSSRTAVGYTAYSIWCRTT